MKSYKKNGKTEIRKSRETDKRSIGPPGGIALDSKGFIYLGSDNTGVYKSAKVVTGLTNIDYTNKVINFKYFNGYIHLKAESNHQQNFDLAILNLDGK